MEGVAHPLAGRGGELALIQKGSTHRWPFLPNLLGINLERFTTSKISIGNAV